MTHRITGLNSIINADTFKEEWKEGKDFILNGLGDWGNIGISNGYINNQDNYPLKPSTVTVVTNQGIKTFEELNIH